MVGASYYFGRNDNIKSELLDVAMVSTSKSIKADDHKELYESISLEKEKEKDFHYPI